MCSDAETIRRSNAARSLYTKGHNYQATRALPNQDHIFSLRDEKRHRELKLKMGPGVCCFVQISHSLPPS